MRFLYAFALCLLPSSLAFTASPATAQTQTIISPQLSVRANDVLRLLQGAEIETEVFDENFRNAVPPAQFRALVQQVSAQQGQPLAISSIEPRNANSAILKVRYEKSIGTVNIDLENDPPHRISGLQLTGFEADGDSIADVMAAIDALPGRQGVLVQSLDRPDLPPIAALDPDGRYAIASAVKLYILAELDRAIQAGQLVLADDPDHRPGQVGPNGYSHWPSQPGRIATHADDASGIGPENAGSCRAARAVSERRSG